MIGSGPGGGVAAQTLASAGHSVLVVERARALSNGSLRGDHLHGKRNAVYNSVAGPGQDHPRISAQHDDRGREHERVVDGDGDAWAYGLNAYAFGGGTRLWQGMAWRFFPEDFEMARVYGNPDGATLADWPIDYDEMEPYYTRAEWELGVAGEESALTARTPRSKGYPMPAMGTEPARELLAGAAERLGWTWGSIPLAINSVPAAGRAACVRCSSCVGHACPVDAKNGAHNTFLPRALATGKADIVFDAEAVVVRDGPGGASVDVMTDCSGEPALHTLRADVVVVAAGAVESARLLLASGLGNDQLGRHLHDHRFVSLRCEVDQPVKNGLGPGHSIATLDHVHAGLDPLGRRRARRSDECASADLGHRPDQRRSSVGRGPQAMDARWQTIRLRRVRHGAGDPQRELCGHPRPGVRPVGHARSSPAQERTPGIDRGRGGHGRVRSPMAARRGRTRHPPSARRRNRLSCRRALLRHRTNE